MIDLGGKEYSWVIKALMANGLTVYGEMVDGVFVWVSPHPDSVVQAVIDGVTLAECKSAVKDAIEEITSSKLEDAVESEYGRPIPPIEMLTWPAKENEARAWKAWDGAGRVTATPNTPTINAELGTQQTVSGLTSKILSRADSLHALRSSIAGNAADLKAAVDAASNFSELAGVDLNSGWPV